MEDFVKVLVVGLFLFTIALVIFAQVTPDQAGEKKEVDSDTIYSSGSLGDIGLISSRKRAIEFGSFSVGYTLGEDNVFSEDRALIESSWFTQKSKSIKFNGKEADRAVIEFTVTDMNSYGALSVYLNGEEIYSNITAPQKFILMSEDLAENNEIVISAESSGPKFWAPTTYVLEDINVIVEKFDDKTKVIPFEIFPYEYSGWGHGTLSFSVDGTEGFADLIASVNGNTVYEGRPLEGDIIEKDFSKKETSLKPGENLMTFRTRKGVSYDLENVEFTVFYYGSGESNIRVVNFDADRWWKVLSETANVTGNIRFFVEKVNIDSGLTVYFNERTYHIPHLDENDWFTLEFTSEDLKVKDNTLKFSATGSYRIGALEVKVVAKE